MNRTSTQQLFDLTGKTALVTGGSGRLGTALCHALAEMNAAVVVGSREIARAKDTAATLPSSAGQPHFGVVIDQLQQESIARGFQHAVEQAGRIDILVNNALEGVKDDLTRITHDEFHRHQGNNAGYFELARRVRDHAVAGHSGASIINLGSMYGEVGSYPDAYQGICSASSVAYHTLKGGTLQLTRHLAVYWARDNVRVNCLSPGPFPNPDTAPSELIARLNTKVPMGRMGQPWELKGAIVFLASDASSYLTGQNLVVDGGWTAW